MARPVHSGERRRDDTRRRSRLRREMALWIALLLGGLVVVVVATTTLISASAARTSTRVAEQLYFAPTSASTRSTDDPGPPSSTPTESATPEPRTTAGPHPSPRPVATTSTDHVGSRQVHPPSPRGEAPGSVPTSIVLAGSRNPIRVVPIGVSAAGVLEPPSDIATAGWWVSGPRPGTPGRAVITGHIDSTAGLGAFAALDLLHSGDTIAVNDANGQTLRFEVTARQQILKTQLDPRLLQHTTNASDLLLVTCIGDFNYSTGSYDSNLLITAVPDRQ